MLKYSVRLTDKDIKNNVLQWREKYLAPDLSYISGVTDVSSHIERFNELSAHNSLSNQGSILSLETENVTRLGYIVIKDKQYKVETINNKGINYYYVFINGKYFYANNNKITVTEWQCETINGIVEKDVIKSIEGDIIKLDTVCWIENGFVEIDGVKYIFDKNEQQEDGTIGCLKAAEDGSIINETDITKCSSIYYAPYTSVKEIHDVCKFRLTKPTYKTIEYNYVKPCEYFFYVDYKNNYYPIRVSGDTNVVCELSPSRNENVYSTELDSGGTRQQVTISGDIKDLNDLVNIASYVDIEGVQYNTQYDYRVSNSSRLIMVDIKDQYSSLNIGDKITFEDSSEDELNLTISSADTSVLYDGKKYPIKKDLVSKAKIDGNEYDIEYPRYSSEFAYVIIDGEQVPMELINSGTSLSRYGLVVNSSSDAAVQEEYEIAKYSGVTIDGRDYMIKDTNGITMVMIEKKDRIRFVVDDIKGNSLLICEPYINTNEYTSDEIKERQKELCDKIVNNQSDYSLLLPNPIFGLMPITNDLAFMVTSTPKSSDDYYDLFNDLVIETNSGYINLPINISANVTNNLLQSELIQEDFCEKEKEKAINPIVDLEKDVYTPKYLKSNKYEGKDTDFYPIYKINFNLHFRTRDLTSWKVNESYNDVSTSGKTDNWFITDYYPYKTIIKNYGNKPAYMNTLMNSSDLVGLLYFNNSDVFYQKSNIAKSFIRLSVYDSTDPQTQSLLATSTIFMNEHDLYKKFIDNSKKNVNEYYTVAESSGDCKTINKINVIGERKTVKKDNGSDVVKVDNDLYLDLDNNKRLSSRISVVNKYETDSSSEGFYLYIFREYSKKLRPKPIYMKVEFNHAGIGKTIPFIVPMDWSTGTTEVNPTSALTFDRDDLVKLKEGIPLERVYVQSYIPLYAVYDFKNKEYVYVFDTRYISMDNGIVNLNLFEMKIKEDTSTESTTNTAVIDINEQFRTDEDNS